MNGVPNFTEAQTHAERHNWGAGITYCLVHLDTLVGEHTKTHNAHTHTHFCIHK